MAVAAPAAAAIPVHYAADTDSPFETFFSKAGLRLKGECDGGGNTDVKVISTRPKSQAGLFHADSQYLGGAGHAYFGTDALYNKSDGFKLLSNLSASDSSVGQVVYADRGRVLTIDWMAESGGDAGAGECVFGGVARTARKGTGSAILFRAREGSPRRTVANFVGTKVRAECTSNGGPDLDLSLKAGIPTSHTFVGSQSDANGDDVDEHGFVAIGPLSSSSSPFDISGVADNASAGQLVVNTSNPQASVDWAATSSGALKRDCVFAGISTYQTIEDAGRITYSVPVAPEPADHFYAHGGLDLTGTCSAAPDISIDASTSVPGSSAHWGVQSDSNQDANDGQYFIEADDLNSGSSIVLDPAEDEKSITELVYTRPGGRYLAADFIADEDGIFGFVPCAASGTSETANAP
jgi:hypothetical protein